MTIQWEKLTEVQNVAASSTGTIRLPIGWIYHGVFLNLTNITAASINELRVIANGQTIMRGSGVEFDTLNQQLGLAAVSAASVLYIPFERLGLQNRTLAEMTSLLTAHPYGDARQTRITSLIIEIDLDATVAPSLTAYAKRDPVQAGRPLWIKRLSKFTQDFSSGENQIDRLTTGGEQYKAVNRIMIDEAAAMLTEMRIERDNFKAWDRTAALNNAVLANGKFNRAAMAGYFIFDTTEDGFGGNLLDIEGISDLRLITQFASAQVGTNILVEYLGGL